jgi:hypothetical protein
MSRNLFKVGQRKTGRTNFSTFTNGNFRYTPNGKPLFAPGSPDKQNCSGNKCKARGHRKYLWGLLSGGTSKDWCHYAGKTKGCMCLQSKC